MEAVRRELKRQCESVESLLNTEFRAAALRLLTHGVRTSQTMQRVRKGLAAAVPDEIATGQQAERIGTLIGIAGSNNEHAS